ncbi:IclR family transcriptional regulator [Nostocoides sp. Soil756]|uniref:IclR family transcriptional regulator n=1 Tax=Nostocoides sp. Soil756 TaxID=1736399 RepID=UPI000B0283B9|nr:IclR family transcriptional regulator [Tetrasphaera sp. Soil756]
MAAESSSVPAVTRAAAILEALAQAAGAPVSVSELARTLGLPKSSTANLCQALESERLVSRVDAGYLLGRRLVELGGAYLATVDQVKEFYAACRREPTISGLTARVAVLDGLDVLYLARYDGSMPIRFTANIGDRFPANCTATGKALLAALPLAALDERLRGRRSLAGLTERSITDVGELRAELDRVRSQGWAADDEETTPGVTCVSIAVPGSRTDSDPFAISVTTISTQFDPSLRDRLLVELREVGAALSNPMVTVA